jgi:hypothetical protein
MTHSIDATSLRATPSTRRVTAPSCDTAAPSGASGSRRCWDPATMRWGATLLGRFVRALHRSRRRHAKRVIGQHQHLIDAAHAHPLSLAREDPRTDPSAGWAKSPEGARYIGHSLVRGI